MNTYPIEPKIAASGTTRENIIPILKSESEGNYIRVRRITTKSRAKFTLNYPSITDAEFEVLESFFEANQGIAFQFTYPKNSKTYNCVFTQDKIEQKNKDGVLSSTQILLEEQ